MILYVNGDSHAGGCESVHANCMLQDGYGGPKVALDSYIRHQQSYVDTMLPFWKEEIGWAPWPDNLRTSYGQLLADQLGAELHCHARAGGSNDRVFRTTQEYLKEFTPDFVLIGWSTWEREEWYNQDDNTWYQVNGSGADCVPEKWRQRYKEFVIDCWNDSNTIINNVHHKIWLLHNELTERNIPHLFFNCYQPFSPQMVYNLPVHDWGQNYLEPYSDFSYFNYLVSRDCRYTPGLHFGPDGHKKWAEFLLPHLTQLL